MVLASSPLFFAADHGGQYVLVVIVAEVPGHFAAAGPIDLDGEVGGHHEFSRSQIDAVFGVEFVDAAAGAKRDGSFANFPVGRWLIGEHVAEIVEEHGALPGGEFDLGGFELGLGACGV